MRTRASQVSLSPSLAMRYRMSSHSLLHVYRPSQAVGLMITLRPCTPSRTRASRQTHSVWHPTCPFANHTQG